MTALDALRNHRDELAAELRTTIARARRIVAEIADVDAAVARLAGRTDDEAPT